MKTRHIIAAIVLLLSGYSVNAQFKIGEISVDSAIFSNYIIDCYRRPDTLEFKSSYDYMPCSNCTVHVDDIRHAQDKARAFNDNILKYGKKIEEGVYTVPRTPSEQDFIKWFNKKKYEH